MGQEVGGGVLAAALDEGLRVFGKLFPFGEAGDARGGAADTARVIDDEVVMFAQFVEVVRFFKPCNACLPGAAADEDDAALLLPDGGQAREGKGDGAGFVAACALVVVVIAERYGELRALLAVCGIMYVKRCVAAIVPDDFRV